MASPSSSSDLSEIHAETPPFRPSDQEINRSNQALEHLAAYLLGDAFSWVLSPAFHATPAMIANSSGVTLGIIPVGLYALSLWTSPEPIVCCVAGSPSNKTFFSLAKKSLRKQEPHSVVIEHSDAENTEFLVHIDSISFRLKYHQNPIISHWGSLIDRDAIQNLLTALPQESRQSFAEVESCNALAEAVENENRRSSFWIIRRWAFHYGLMSDLCESITSQDIFVMSLLMCAKDEPRTDLRVLLTHLCEKPIESTIFEQTAIGLGLKKLKMTRNKRALIDKARYDTLERFYEMRTILSEGTADSTFFFAAYEKYIRIDATLWGNSSVKGARTARAIEHAISKLGKRLVKHYSDIVFHAWPRPFAYSKLPGSQQVESQSNRDTDELVYCIGMSYSQEEGQDGQPSLPDTQTASLWFSKELNPLLEADHDSLYTNVEVVQDAETSGLFPSMKQWGPISEASRQDDSDDSDQESDSKVSTPRKARSGSSALVTKIKDVNSSAVTRPLRPALDVLHRIQYDSSLDASDYVVGYLDRHRTELQEMPVEWWVSKDATSEEFIPQSRIRFFKRISDNTIVWDREARKDLIFWSGKGG